MGNNFQSPLHQLGVRTPILTGLLCASFFAPVLAAQQYDMNKSWEAGRREWESNMGSFYAQFKEFDDQWKRNMASQREYAASHRSAPAAVRARFSGHHLELAKKALATDELNADELMEFAFDYLFGRGVKKDTNQAIYWFTQTATNLNWTPAQIALGDIYLGSYGGPVDDAKAGQWYLLAAKNGDLETQLAVAEMYALGRGLEKNDAEAARWASVVGSKLSASGNSADLPSELRSHQEIARVAETLALIYALAGKDEANAIKWFAFSADFGKSESALYAAVLLLQPGAKTPSASALGFHYAKVASDAGQTEADQMVCLGYLLGRGTEKDGPAALPYCLRAASRSEILAMRELGFAYLDGKLLPSDGASAVAWLSKAAVLGDLPAQVGLGYAYLRGNSVSRDTALAAEWFQKTAEHNALAAFALATLYDAGDGVAADRDKAIWYMRKSAELGDADASHILAGWIAPGGKFAQAEVTGPTGIRARKLDLPLLGVSVAIPQEVDDWNITTTILGGQRVHVLSQNSTRGEIKLIFKPVQFDTCEDSVSRIGTTLKAGESERLPTAQEGWYPNIVPLSSTMWLACRKSGITNALVVFLVSQDAQPREYFFRELSESAWLVDAIAGAMK